MKTLIRLGLSFSLLNGALAAAQEPYYDAKGRRDPFLSPTGLSNTDRSSCPGQGLPGQLVQEVALRGIVRTHQGRTALLVGSDGKTHFASEGARLCDGRIARVDADAVLFVEQVRDPSAPRREVEVRRLLHPER
jgi:Tfp pilus assembly protein PilP